MTTDEFVLATSTPHTALSHLALYGLAAILEDVGHPDIRLSWTGHMDPRPRIHSALRDADIGAAVRDHAAHRAKKPSWLQEIFTSQGRTMALMSPRISKLDRDEWTGFQQERHRVLDTLVQDHAWFDQRLIAALGEPCYWSRNPKGEPLQDDASSRWDMQPRNRGSELVTNRLRPLADVLSSRTPEQIVSGLTGETVDDAVGKNQSDSRTATGLAPPGPTDNALAWCALSGISQLALTHWAGSRSTTTGHSGPAGAGTMTLPAWTRPWTLRRLRTILTSPALRTFADPDFAERDRTTTRRWLYDRHVAAVVRFPIHRFGTDKAPERRTQHGTIHTTDSP